MTLGGQLGKQNKVEIGTKESSIPSSSYSNQEQKKEIQSSDSSSSNTKSESSETQSEPKSTQTSVSASNQNREKPVVQQSQSTSKVMLKVTPQIQRAWNTCAPTTVSMMLSYRGIEVSQEVLAQEMGTDTTFGTHNANAIQVLNRHLFGYDFPQANQAGYRLETVTTADVHSDQMRLFKQRLKQNIADGYPMYYTFDSSKIYPGLRGEHNVIGIGYQLSGDGSDIAYLYYIDPSPNVQDSVYGGLKKVSPQELFESMLTCVEPNYGW
ncbi:C39 family peptidase [Streptococcus suis]|uniref:Peptidase C39-like domain-containing protein n=1 Tax=Streptococcus suis TaxID=1307 RepID=A0A4T2GMW3_STRSU|nr:C39 family peptidase [Streptococcus suis]MBM7268878.1 C39 family peptidase [Streptococcus suis]MBM7269408.1 C39 family peptidase [Streptococcus suis]TII00469.1 hypothetical protein FAJ39_03665 [Streptococcus suis]TII01314.1 hypothetical protein FAJ39_00925 [Streptococcus suis]